MKQKRMRIFSLSLLLCAGFFSTSLFAERLSPEYKVEKTVYFLMEDFVNEWGWTNFDPADEKWEKGDSSLPPTLSKEEIELLLEINKKGQSIPQPPREKDGPFSRSIDYAAFDGDVYVFYGLSPNIPNIDTRYLIVFAEPKNDMIFAMSNITGSPYEYTRGFLLPVEYQEKWLQLISDLRKRFEEYKIKEQNIKNKEK